MLDHTIHNFFHELDNLCYSVTILFVSKCKHALTRSFLPGFGDSIAIRVTASASPMFGKIIVVVRASDNKLYIDADVMRTSMKPMAMTRLACICRRSWS